jgi:hypothetical protein
MMMTDAEAIAYLTQDTGRVPCSRYGTDSVDCAPVAVLVARILERETGDHELSTDDLEYAMGLVVNDHDDVEYLIREYATPEERASVSAEDWEDEECSDYPHWRRREGLRDMTDDTIVYVAGWNMAGYLPEMEPCHFLTHEEARRFLIAEILDRADYLGESEFDEDKDRADAAAAIAEDVNLWSGPDSCLVEMSEHRDDAFWINTTTIGELRSEMGEDFAGFCDEMGME